MEPETLTITFPITEGDAWVDPEGTAWYVRAFEGNNIVALERVDVTRVNAKQMARRWRRAGDTPPAPPAPPCPDQGCGR